MKNFSICFDLPSLLINTVQVSSYIGIYYAVRELFIPRYFDQGKWLVFVVALIVWTLVVLFFWNQLMGLLRGLYGLPALTLPASYGAYILEGVQMFVPGMILLAWESFEDANNEEKRLHLIEKEKLSTELKYLKSKVNPQFIFNTLRSLKIYVDAKSGKAPDMILRLSEVLDYVLYKSQQQSVNLKEEVAVIQDFLELERLRLGEGFELQLNTEGDTSIAIAPLTLLSLVQNVLKDSMKNRSNGFLMNILILAKTENLKCEIHINDPDINDLPKNDLSELERQLILTYPNQYALSQSVVNNSLITSLALRKMV